MTQNVFYDGLNKYCRKYLVANEIQRLSRLDVLLMETRHKQIEAEVFELFLLFDKVSLKVYGENIPMASMLNWFGEKNFEALIEQEAFNFVLWTPMIGQLNDFHPGVDFLVSGNHSSKAHCDPEESIELGFQWMVNKPSRMKRRMFVRKLRDLYKLPDERLPHNTVALTKSAYESGKLDVYGFDGLNKPLQELSKAQKDKIVTCADDLLEYSFFLSNRMTSYSKKEFYSFFQNSQQKISNSSALVDNFCTVATLEQFPDLKTFYSQIEAPFHKLAKTRAKHSAKKFRQWLEQVSSDSDAANEVTKQYVDAIVDEKGFFQSRTGKFTKTIAMSAIGAGVGYMVAGPIGSYTGAAAAKVLEPVAGVALDLIDEFMLDGLTKGWTPKVFFEDMEKLKQEKN